MGLFDIFKKKGGSNPASKPEQKKVSSPQSSAPAHVQHTKVQIYYMGDGINTRQSVNTRQGVTKKVLLPLNKKVQDYGYACGWNSLRVDFSTDHIKIYGGGSLLQDNDINGASNEYIRSIESYTWCD